MSRHRIIALAWATALVGCSQSHASYIPAQNAPATQNAGTYSLEQLPSRSHQGDVDGIEPVAASSRGWQPEQAQEEESESAWDDSGFDIVDPWLDEGFDDELAFDAFEDDALGEH